MPERILISKIIDDVILEIIYNINIIAAVIPEKCMKSDHCP